MGSMKWENVPSVTTAPDRLPPSALVYDGERDVYVGPEGQLWGYDCRDTKRAGLVLYRYTAEMQDCQGCARKPQCCPENQERGRSVMRLEESAPVVAFRQKRAADEARAQYRRRSQVAESCHAWIKSKLDLRQFHVRGFGPDADGSAVGLPHLQPPTLDSFAQIASCHGNHLSEKRRKPETTERNVLALQS